MKTYYKSFLFGTIITNSRPSEIDPSRKKEILINFLGRIIQIELFDSKHPDFQLENSFGLFWGFNLGPVSVDYWKGEGNLLKGRFKRFTRRIKAV